MEKYKPAIVAIGYNRYDSMSNLLESLSSANYNTDAITLIISIDYEDSINNLKVVEVAENFIWKYGNKKIIKANKNLGLRKHILQCGNYVNEYGSIIMLEDDIFVSPYFYTYATRAMEFYDADENIGGVSLYNHNKNFLNRLPFITIANDSDVYFLQIASSWGQAWTKQQWNQFKDWYSENSYINLEDNLPYEVINWPESSWLKYFIKYLVVTNKFFVYPKNSLTTNFGFAGTHQIRKNPEFQVPLYMGDNYRFQNLKESINVYDVFFEILPDRLDKKFTEDISIDLYGKKDTSKITTKYLISSKNINSEKVIMSFGLELKPLVLNIMYDAKGDVFKLGCTKDFSNDYSGLSRGDIDVFSYFNSTLPLKSMFILMKNSIINRLNAIIK